MNLTLVTDATADQEPLSLKEALDYLRIEHNLDNAQVQTMITAARIEAELESGREQARKQWRLTLDRFPVGYSEWMGLPVKVNGMNYWCKADGVKIVLLDPLATVDAFTYRKATGDVVTMVADTNYIVDTDKHPGIVIPASGQWPTDELWPTSAVQLTFTAGATPETVGANIKQGMMLLVSQWYEDRIPFTAIRFAAELPFSVTSLFRNGKLWRL